MKITISSVAFAIFAGLANAKVMLTNSEFIDIEAGKTFEITWADAEGPVTLTLKNGPSDDLQTVQVLTTNADGESFQWAVDPALPEGDYTIEIDDGVEPNYSVMFPVTGGPDAPSSSASSSMVTSTISSASSSSTSESSSTESSTDSESSTSSSDSSSTTGTSSSTSATSTSATSTTSETAEPTIPNNNSAHSMAAPFIPGLLAILGAALL